MSRSDDVEISRGLACRSSASPRNCRDRRRGRSESPSTIPASRCGWTLRCPVSRVLKSRENWLVGVAPILGTFAIVGKGDRSLPPQTPRRCGWTLRCPVPTDVGSCEGWLVGVTPVLGTVTIVGEGDRSLPPQPREPVWLDTPMSSVEGVEISRELASRSSANPRNFRDRRKGKSGLSLNDSAARGSQTLRAAARPP